MAHNAPDKSISFKETLNLPTTDFPIVPKPSLEDTAMLARWEQEDLFTKSFYCNEGQEKFIIHDGPPYANGPIHLGHAYNKITKDIMGKSQRMSGKQVPITPGWDCHGLPIEQKVNKELPGLSSQALRKECRLYAEKWIEVQKDQFKKLGVLMDWKRPYLTMNFSYEAAILQAFGLFVEKGYIQKKKKTVPWCPTDQTVLASAEIEYHDQKDPSIYVLFTLTSESVQKAFPTYKGTNIHSVVWTTTPWTLPLNRAVLVRPHAPYELIAWKDNDYLLVGAERAQELCSLLEIEKKSIAHYTAEQLVGLTVQHPFLPRTSPFIADGSVSTQEGTAFVHCAPGCGPQDYDVALQHNLEIFSPISPDGKYTAEIKPQELEGMTVADGQIWVLRTLQAHNKLLLKKNIVHAYPHCWRCRNRLIFRATEQWFCDLAHNDLRKQALQAVDQCSFIPKNSNNFLRATLEGRLEWCLSRQRVWGVPIPALRCSSCSWVYTNRSFIDKVAEGVAKEGIEYWHTVSFEDLEVNNLECQRCKCKQLVKEQDILDVWFDSGVSHYAVLYDNAELAFPANIYIEGVDQHRGWFQSSLLTSLVVEGAPSTKTFLTHGFVVDDKGHKMSKSLGNVTEPQDIINQLGTDGLRLWVSSIDYGGDAVVSKVLLNNVGQVFRKIRNTCRFLLANLYDFKAAENAVDLESMLLIDRYALHELCQVNYAIRQAYDNADFTGVYHQLTDYCTVSLSSLYLDIIKDRLYTAAASSPERRSAQTACYLILDTLTRLCAPVLSYMAESVSDYYQQNKDLSIHLQLFADLESLWNGLAAQRAHSSKQESPLFYPYVGRAQEVQNEVARTAISLAYANEWELLLSIRSATLKAIETLRAEGIIKHSLEAKLTLYFDFNDEQQDLYDAISADLKSRGQSVEQFFKEFFIVSQCVIASTSAGFNPSILPFLLIKVEKATGVKCPRCWQWGESSNQWQLCERCELIVQAIKNP